VIRLSHQRVLVDWSRARTIVAESADFYRIREEIDGSLVRDLLDRPSFRDAAAHLGRAIRGAPGAAGAADVLEPLARNQNR